MDNLKINQIVFTDVNKAEFLKMEDFDLSSLDDDSVVVKTAVSTISSGTEKANVTGNKFVPGNEIKPKFPRSLGYSSAGSVVAVGKKVDDLKVGDRVVVFWGNHKNYNIVNKANCVKIPDGVDFYDAAISFIGTFSLAAIRKTKLEIGESLMVTGLGLLGQLAVKLARVNGAYPIIAADMSESRRELALKNGADYAFDPLDKDFAKKVREVSGGGVKTAIEVTGVGAGLDETLDCMAKLGRVALLGCTRDSNFSINYYGKVHFPGITLVGAHTIARPENESYPNYFTHQDDIKAILNLIKGGRLSLKDMVSEIHDPKDCEEIYKRLATDKDFPIGVQFKW